MKRILIVLCAFALLVTCPIAEEIWGQKTWAQDRYNEYLFGMQFSDTDNVGSSGTAFFEWGIPIGNVVRIGPILGVSYLSPEDGPSFTGYDLGGLVAFDFGSRSDFFLEGTLMIPLNDAGDIIDYTYGIGGGYKVWSGRVLVKVQLMLEQVKFENSTLDKEDRLVSGIAIGFGR